MTTELGPNTRTGSMADGVMSPAEKTAAITRVSYMEHDIFDDGGHVRRGLNRTSVEETVVEINDLRRALGWLEINAEGEWRWPR